MVGLARRPYEHRPKS